MDHARFDRITRWLAAGGSRRGVVRGAVAAVAGGGLAALGQAAADASDVSAENCIPEGKRCGRGKRKRPCKKCCTKNVIRDQKGRRRCSCVRLGNSCSNDSQCCEGICESRVCKLSTCVPLRASCASGDTCCAGVCDSSLAACCIETNAAGCTRTADCCDPDAICQGGACIVPSQCVPLQDACTPSDTCCDGVCDDKRDVCCIETDTTGCDVNEDCCNPLASCDKGTCTLPPMCKSLQEPCDFGVDTCCEGICGILEERCCLELDGECDENEDCCSGACDEGKCGLP